MPGECVKEWAESLHEGQPYLGPTTGIQFSDNYPDGFSSSPNLFCQGITKVTSVEEAMADPKAIDYFFEHYYPDDNKFGTSNLQISTYFFGGKPAQAAPLLSQ